MNRILSLTRRNIKEILREPVSLAFLIALPIVMQVLFYFIFHKLTAQFEMQYLAPGMIGFANTFLCLFVAMLVSTDRESSFITRIYTTPVKPYQFILSYLFSAIPLGLIQSALIILLGIVIDGSFLSVSLLIIFPASLLSIILFASLGILFGSSFYSKAVGGIASIVVSCHSILSGMWFPLEGLSKGFVTFMKALPFKNVNDLFINLAKLKAVDSAFEQIWLPIAIILGYTMLSLLLSCWLFVKNSKQK